MCARGGRVQSLDQGQQCLWRCDGILRNFGIVRGDFRPARRPIQPHTDEAECVGAFHVAGEIVTHHHYAPVVFTANTELIQCVDEDAGIGFFDTDFFGNSEGVEAVVQLMLGEDVGEGRRRPIGDQCEWITKALQCVDDLRRARDEIGAQRHAAGIFDFAAFIDQRVPAVEADGEQMLWGIDVGLLCFGQRLRDHLGQRFQAWRFEKPIDFQVRPVFLERVARE